MAYEKILAGRVRQALGELPGLVEKKMFGGVGYMVRGNMACGVNKDDLIVRVGPEHYEEYIHFPHTRPFDFTGRPMIGWVMVAPAGYEVEQDLETWVQRGVDFALTLPPK
ncbi:MAG: TfoX/Sxy family protein [Anaerolineales bacterium]|nr:TfoX/Sxy family protein [Anaerolineales bacterium]